MIDHVTEPYATEHKSTAVMLHAMYGSPRDFDGVAKRLAVRGVKTVALASPRRTVHWPTGAEEDVAAWYDYYTCRDGQDEHDIINIRHLDAQAGRLQNIVCREAATLEKHGGVSKVSLVGSSQGGTVVLRLLSCFPSVHHLVDSVVCLRTCPLHTVPTGLARTDAVKPHISKERTSKSRLVIFAGVDDQVYSLGLQRKAYGDFCSRLPQRQWARPSWVLEQGLDHSSYSQGENDTVMRFVGIDKIETS